MLISTLIYTPQFCINTTLSKPGVTDNHNQCSDSAYWEPSTAPRASYIFTDLILAATYEAGTFTSILPVRKLRQECRQKVLDLPRATQPAGADRPPPEFRRTYPLPRPTTV